MFSGNEAVVASVVFTTNLDLCSWLQFDSPLFNPARVFRWGFVHFRYYIILGLPLHVIIMQVIFVCSDDNRNSAHEPDAYNPEWYIQTPAQNINVTASTVS